MPRVVAGIDPVDGELTASFDGRTVTYGFGELDMPVPAYAATIHKSQGSEYPAVVIPVMTQHYPMLQRNLLYTGVTRGKRLVVLVGQKKAVAIAVRNVSGRRQDEPPRPIAAQGCDRQADGAKACREACAPQDSNSLAPKASAPEHLRSA